MNTSALRTALNGRPRALMTGREVGKGVGWKVSTWAAPARAAKRASGGCGETAKLVVLEGVEGVVWVK